MGDFGEIYYHFYTVIFTTLGKMTDADKVINPQHFAIFGAMRQTSGSECGLIRKSGFESRIIFG